MNKSGYASKINEPPTPKIKKGKGWIARWIKEVLAQAGKGSDDD